MNKIFIVFIVAVAIIGIGTFLGTGASKTCLATGETITIDMTIGSWYFAPDTIRADCGDRVVINAYNEDPYDHGIGLDLFGINKRIIAKTVDKIEFTANEKGTFTFYCTVPCGSGIDKITKLPKGHFDQKGKIIIS